MGCIKRQAKKQLGGFPSSKSYRLGMDGWMVSSCQEVCVEAAEYV